MYGPVCRDGSQTRPCYGEQGMPEITVSEWEEFLAGQPQAHLLQTSAWGKLKAGFGWQPAYVLSPSTSIQAAGAQVLFRQLPLGVSLAYIPKGPVGCLPQTAYAGWEALWPEMDRVCRQRRAIFLKVEPDLWGGSVGEAPLWANEQIEFCAAGTGDQPPAGFNPSVHSVQPRRTLVVDLCGDEEQVLGRMKQKTRYNIRLAQKKGVTITLSQDLEIFSGLMAVTGERDAFGVHSPDYYRRAFDLFSERGECALLLAEFGGEPLAAVMVFARGTRAWYFYGASSDAHRERMPTYLLQWEAMRWARSRGCTLYDLWGVPDADEQTLEANFSSRSDGLWGVYRFKRGFGGQLLRSLGPWDRVYNTALYGLYGWWMRSRQAQGE